MFQIYLTGIVGMMQSAVGTCKRTNLTHPQSSFLSCLISCLSPFFFFFFFLLMSVTVLCWKQSSNESWRKLFL